MDIFSPLDAETLVVTRVQVVRWMEALMRPESWPFLQSQHRTETMSKIQCHEWESWFTEPACGSGHPFAHEPAIPRDIGKYKIILHAYAGRRRRGDIEWYFASLAAKFPDHNFLIASIDIILSTETSLAMRLDSFGCTISNLDMSLRSLPDLDLGTDPARGLSVQWTHRGACHYELVSCVKSCLAPSY